MQMSSLEKELSQFQYVNLNLEELMNFADENQIQFEHHKLEKEISLLIALEKPLALHKESFKNNWTFDAMNTFTQHVKRTFKNRHFKASDANHLQFYYNEHTNKVEFMLKPNNSLSEISRLTLLKNMCSHLEYLKKGINVKSYFQLRSYIQKFGHEETPAVLKRKKMDLRNIHKRVDNTHHIDDVLKYEQHFESLKMA